MQMEVNYGTLVTILVYYIIVHGLKYYDIYGTLK